VGRTLFVSYSRADLDAVVALVEDSQKLGHEPWFDQELTGGQRWWDEILCGIRVCDVFVPCLSPGFVTSEACRAEYEYATALGKPVLPVLVHPAISDSLLPPSLSQVQRIDYTRADTNGIIAFVRALEAMPDAPQITEPWPAAPAVPATYLFDLLAEIRTAAPIDVATQGQILDQIEDQLSAGHDPGAIHQLLVDLRSRDDLLVRTAERIAALEASLAKTATGPTLPPLPDQRRAGSSAGAAFEVTESHGPGREPAVAPASATSSLPGPAHPMAGDAPHRGYVAESPPEQDVNVVWWIAPVLFGLLGGIVAWLANRSTDRAAARNMIIAGIVSSIIWIGLGA
jgi:hypothetical protein